MMKMGRKLSRNGFFCLAAFFLMACGNDGPTQEQIQEDPNEIKVVVTNKVCDPHELLCDNICVDVKSSAQFCGDCTTQCEGSQVCVNGQCEWCKNDDVICGQECVDTTKDLDHCGACNHGCSRNQVCKDSTCVCSNGYYDCDGKPENGCETYGFCFCNPGDELECYDGPDHTRDVGECRSGKMRCMQTDDGDWLMSQCIGTVTPRDVHECTDKDYNCNGKPDGHEDYDGDGYSICQGDCCDNLACALQNPELINPGMLEVADNQIDDNCDGRVDERPLSHKDVETIPFSYGGSDFDQSAAALAQSLGILAVCAPDSSCAYGLVSAKLTRSASTAPPNPAQVNVMSAMKDAAGISRVLPREGNSFAMLSSGRAQDVKSGVGLLDFEPEQMTETMVAGKIVRVAEHSRIPEVYRDAHNGKLATHELCVVDDETPAILDSVQLSLKIKVPTNVKGIQFDFRFFSREYPEFLCSKFNDFFLALLTSTHEDMQEYPDRNIAFDMKGNPVSVNNGFFTTCRKVPCDQAKDCPAFMTCDASKYCTAGAETCRDGDLAISAYYPQPYGYGQGRGGATAWLTTKAPVVPGETIDLDFYIWDTGDRKYDSSVILDNFQWLVDETKVSTGFADEVN